jgi:hypothetical protein
VAGFLEERDDGVPVPGGAAGAGDQGVGAHGRSLPLGVALPVVMPVMTTGGGRNHRLRRAGNQQGVLMRCPTAASVPAIAAHLEGVSCLSATSCEAVSAGMNDPVVLTGSGS